MRALKLLAASLAMAACAALAQAAPKADLQFDANSKEALVVFESATELIVPVWNLQFFAFSLEDHKWTYGVTHGNARFGELSGAPGFHAALVPPGTYAINSIDTQSFWGACFNGGTKAFNLEAGKVTFIGLIDPNPALADISTKLPKKTGGKFLTVFDTPRVALIPASLRANWESELTAYLARQYPGVKAPLVGAEPIDTTFTAKFSLMAAGKICEKF